MAKAWLKAKRDQQGQGKEKPTRLRQAGAKQVVLWFKNGGGGILSLWLKHYMRLKHKSRLWSPWEPIILYFWATWGYTVAHQPKGLPRNPAVRSVGGRQMLHLELLYPGPRRSCRVSNRWTRTEVQRECELTRFHLTHGTAAFETSVQRAIMGSNRVK